MALFEYIARNRDGQQVTGTLTADTEAAAVRLLDDRQLFPVSVEPKAQPTARLALGRTSPRQVGMVYGQIADLLNAGVPLMRSIETVMRAMKGGALQGALTKVGEDVSAGETLADAMGQHPAIFKPLHVAMIRAGERGGFLEQVLSDLSRFVESQDDLKSKVVGALVYPAVLVIIGIGVVLLLLLWLVPKFKDFMVDIELPLPSRVLFALSDGLHLHWPFVVLGLGIVLVIMVRTVRSPGGRATLDRLVLRVPLIGGAIQMVALTRFCRILGTLLQAGVPILQSLQISRDAAGLAPLAQAIDDAGENVKAGQPLHEPLGASRMFPPDVLEMIAVAEESNQMENTLLRIADTVERRTNRKVDLAVRLLEPALLVCIASVVGFVALGLILPIFEMASQMQ